MRSRVIGSRRFSLMGALVGALVLTACPEEPPQPTLGGNPQVGGMGQQPAAGGGPGDIAQPAPSDQAQPEGSQPTGEQAAPKDPNEGKGLILGETFPDTLTQEAIKTAGSYITIRGMVLGDACKGKAIRVDAVTPKELSNRLITFTLNQDIGRYELLVPKGPEQIYVMASCDLNGDGRIHPDSDMNAAFPKNPVPATADVEAVVLRLTQDKIVEGMPPIKDVPPPPPGEAGAAPSGQPAGGAPGAGAAQPGAPAQAQPAPAQGSGR